MHYANCEHFTPIVMTMIDLYKAHPSFNWNTMMKICEAYGIISPTHDTNQFWNALHDIQRCARYRITGTHNDFTLPHGFKEGDGTSSLAFIFAYSAILSLYNKHYRECTGTDDLGVRLLSTPDEIVLHRENHISKLIFPHADEIVVSTHINEVEYADDTTFYDSAATIADASDTNPSSSLYNFISSTVPTGIRENTEKRLQDFLLNISARNLGVNTNGDADTTTKISSGWKAYHLLRTRIGGIKGIDMTNRGTLMCAMI